MSYKPFVHLHNHSDYSILDATSTVDDLAKTAKAMGMNAVALTDHGNMMGVLTFQKACKKAGVKPIIGCEVYVAPKSRHDRSSDNSERNYYHLVLIAKNETGYKNLLKLTSLGYTEGFYHRPRIDDELLEKYSEGLICSSACLGGEIALLLLNNQIDKAKEKVLYYSNLFGKDHYYIEIQNHGTEQDTILCERAINLANETGIPLLATNDVHYLRKEDASDHHVFLCIGSQKTREESNRGDYYKNCYFRSQDEMYELFSYIPQALTNSQKIADMCDLSIKEDGPKLPNYQIPSSFSSDEEYLHHLVFTGLKDRYSEVSDEIKKRAEFEISTIAGMGFIGYFLIVWDFIDYAKQNKISVGPGRGSGAGSIVAYALKITDVDPLKYNLLFERFLNPERVSMPDFDIDFDDERRDEVVAYITKKYGDENVAGITTYSTLQTKAVLKDIARVLDIPYNESLLITKAVSDDAKDVTDALNKSDELKTFNNKGGKYKELFEIASRLEGRLRGIGMHACGKVIGQSAVSDFVPLMIDTKTKMINTAFDSTQIEACGLVKMDFLGLTTLSIIERSVALIKQTNPDFDIEKISDTDDKTFKLFCDGKTGGVFQFESEGMQSVLMDAKPSNIEDLIALNALYRPGPMQFIPEFVKGKHNPKNVKYFHKVLEECLKPTYGVIVYQEQVMQVAQIFCGYTLGGADLLRRIMGKKKPEEMAKEEVTFVSGAIKQGHSESEGKELFKILEPFAGYGFNKSHAAAYSIIAYKTAYLKAHYPAEFMAANLTKSSDSPSAFRKLLDETKAMSITIEKPDINQSNKDFSVSDGSIYYGFLALKGVGDSAVNEIIEARKTEGNFTSFIDFTTKVKMQSVNKRTIEALIKTGMFDKIEKHNRGTLLANFENVVDYVINKKNDKGMGASLFGDEIPFPDFVYKEQPDLAIDEKLAFEKEIAGFYISGHPLDKYRELHEKHHNIDLLELENYKDGMNVKVVGALKQTKLAYTKKGDQMFTAVIEDFYGTIALVIFSKEYDKFKDILDEGKVYIVRGKFKADRGGQITVADVQKADGYDESLQETSPLDKYKNLHAEQQNIDLLALDNCRDGMLVKIVGLLKQAKVINTKKGDEMLVGKIEDFNGSISFVAFPEIYSKFKDILANDEAFVVRGKFGNNEKGQQIIVEDLQPADNYDIAKDSDIRESKPKYDYKKEENVNYPKKEIKKEASETKQSLTVKLFLKNNIITNETLASLKTFLMGNNGIDTVILCYVENNNLKEVKLKDTYNIDYRNCKEKLNEIDMLEKVEVL